MTGTKPKARQAAEVVLDAIHRWRSIPACAIGWHRQKQKRIAWHRVEAIRREAEADLAEHGGLAPFDLAAVIAAGRLMDTRLRAEPELAEAICSTGSGEQTTLAEACPRLGEALAILDDLERDALAIVAASKPSGPRIGDAVAREIVAIIAAAGEPLCQAAVRAALAEKGLPHSERTVRNRLKDLRQQGFTMRLPDGETVAQPWPPAEK